MSIIFGNAMIFTAFDPTVAIVSAICIVIGLLILTFFSKTIAGRIYIVLTAILGAVLCWVPYNGENGHAARFFVITAAIPHAFFVLFEVTTLVVSTYSSTRSDEVEESDIEVCGTQTFKTWGVNWWAGFWLTISTVVTAGTCVGGIYAF